MTLIQPPISVSRYAWFVLALLWPVALLNYMDRQMMAAMKESLMGDIAGLDSEAKWGLLPAVFKWVYAGLSPFGGYLADRFSKKVVITVSLFVWSAITWATGHAVTYDQLIWSRAIMGVSEACYIPAALALIADYHVGPTRSRAIGIHQMAIYVGVMIGGFSGYAADAPSLGWRWAFDAVGFVGVVYAIPLFFLLKDKPLVAGETTAKPSVGSAVTELLTNKYFIMLVLYFTLPALAGWVIKDWMPAILKSQFNIGQGKAGVSATLYVNIASLAGAVIGGILADRWMKKTIRGRIYISAIGMCFLVPALFGVGNANTLLVAICFLALFGLGWGFFDCNNMPILCQIVRPELRATGYGIMNLVSISCGGFADWGFGVMRDGGVALNVIFGAFASVCVLSAVLVLLIKPKANLN
ncbi:MFS transporter [Phragmitibacter flavus]|uniref:MFS transporter n=1 Tax=Phragmitibacter flavus TaxID=2576071 RepID=A0A5R8KCB0_9BACT|nr:MFS transporter [Phragmitibacter flavus]TLD69931.1 MFS transporter [Phragmitibacter flavus]